MKKSLIIVNCHGSFSIKKAFSFTETAIVVVVIGIITTMLAPGVYRLINQFRDDAAAASARTLIPALVLHWEDHGGFLDFDPATAVAERGGPVMAGGTSIGAHLPEIDSLRWHITDVSRNSISIEWAIDDCPDCRNGLQLDMVISEDGGTEYPKWEYYHYR